MSFVFLVDTKRQPLSPVHPGRARLLLKAGKAAVLKRYPFTLILKAAIEQPQVQPLRLKLDPGSRTTGIAIVDDESGQVLFAAELAHRSQQIKKALDSICNCSQLNEMGTLRAIEGERTPPGVWQRWDDEVQPPASQLAQNALARCRVRGESHATGAPGQADQATSNHRQGAWLSPDVLNE